MARSIAPPTQHKTSGARRRAQRQRQVRWAVMGAVVASATLAPRMASSVSAQTSREQTLRFDIPAGPLRTVLPEFERISGWRLVLTGSTIGDITSSGLAGTYTVEQALARLLEGTSVTQRVTGANVVTLEIRLASESVDVAGVIPVAAPSSPKYVRPITEVPQTIDVIPREVMEAQGVTTLSEALRNVPGISLQAGEGGGASSTTGDMFNMRGFSANNSLFVDGVRDDGLMSRDVFNLEQVEVFMGPTGSDVGRGNAAGYVNMETKTPHVESAYALSYRYGSGAQNRSTIDVNHALNIGAPGSWLSHSAIRLNGLWQKGGVPGRDVVDQKNQAVAPSIAFGLATPTRVTVSAQVTRQDNTPDYGIPGAAWREAPLAPTTVLAARDVDSANFYGSPAYDYDKVEQESYTARVERDVNPNITVRNQTRYNQTHRTAVISTVQSPASFVADTQLVTIGRQGNERENKITSNQTSAIARFVTGKLRHMTSSGLEFSHEMQFAPTLVGVGTRDPVSIYAPNPNDPVVGFAPARSGAYNRGKTNSIGLYAFDSIDAGNKWQLSAGLRWDHYDAKYHVVDATGLTTTDVDAADGLFSGKFGVLYKLSGDANLYFSYGSTVTPPGTANFTLSAQANNQNNPNVKPQESKNYEIGSKVGLFRNRLSFSGALFRTDNKNVIFTVDATAVPPIYNQDDGQLVNGVSVGALGQLNSHWQVIANFGYLDTRQVSQNAATNGKDLTLTPPFSGSLWTTYQLPRGVTVGGGVRRMDDVFINTANTIRVPGYSVADAMAQFAVGKHLSLRLNVNNITDVVYIRNVNNNGGRYNPGTPRSATITSSVVF